MSKPGEVLDQHAKGAMIQAMTEVVIRREPDHCREQSCGEYRCWAWRAEASI
jgi:hypothetical protein